MAQQNHDAVVEALSHLLADSYTLYLKTHNYHWNVTGPFFNTLHTLFQSQYEELALAVDEIAERIRALGAFSPGSYAAFAKLTKIREDETHIKSDQMIKNLADDQDKVIAAANAVLKAAEKGGDQATMDLAVRRIQHHEKSKWMLASHLEK